MEYIADTSFITHHFKIPKVRILIPESVFEEIRYPSERLKIALWEVEIINPKKRFVKKVMNEAKKIGYLERLSKADIDVLALALERKGVILTNDFAIQNVARRLKIKFEGDIKIKKYKKRRKKLEERLKE